MSYSNNYSYFAKYNYVLLNVSTTPLIEGVQWMTHGNYFIKLLMLIFQFKDCILEQ